MVVAEAQRLGHLPGRRHMQVVADLVGQHRLARGWRTDPVVQDLLKRGEAGVLAGEHQVAAEADLGAAHLEVGVRAEGQNAGVAPVGRVHEAQRFGLQDLAAETQLHQLAEALGPPARPILAGKDLGHHVGARAPAVMPVADHVVGEKAAGADALPILRECRCCPSDGRGHQPEKSLAHS
ncbi:hypothetical protein [Pseudoruegeria aquimaris]|uniref:hypothetical protein n=1 Tax=Pseudoruegeria aquimaris TaxID=393663 RepID=UPI0023DDDCAF|nr:hypothetical protein [Pseudoruegeria aquimaris]